MTNGFVLPSVLLAVALLGMITVSAWLITYDTHTLIINTSVSLKNREVDKNLAIAELGDQLTTSRGIDCVALKTHDYCILSLLNNAVDFSSYFNNIEDCKVLSDESAIIQTPRSSKTCLSINDDDKFETSGNLQLESDLKIQSPVEIKVKGVIKLNSLTVDSDLFILSGSHIDIEQLTVSSNGRVTILSPRIINIISSNISGYLRKIDRTGDRVTGTLSSEDPPIHLLNQLRWGIIW